METNMEQNKQVNDEEEYVLLDLNEVCVQSDIPPNAPYVLSIGEYQEAMGTCYLFSERDKETAVLHPETGSSERDLFKEKCIIDSNPAPSKQVQPITGLHKVLKFRLATEDETKPATRISASIL